MDSRVFDLDRDRNKDPVYVDVYCPMTRVYVSAVPASTLPNNVDANGRPLYCSWLVPNQPRDTRLVLHGWDAPGRWERWTDPGSVLLRAGGTLYLKGGRGKWVVTVGAALEVWQEPEFEWLTSYYLEQTKADFPPRATAMRLLSGSGTAGGHALTLGTKYPVSALGEDVQLQGFWQAGTKI